MFTFFVVNIWLVGMCVPYNDPDLISKSGTLGSPFVIAIKRADAMWFAHVINGFVFLTVISCGITSVYVASRSLTALSDIKLIHPFFGKKDNQGRPYVSLIICITLGGGLCYLNCNSTGAEVYGWFSSLVRKKTKPQYNQTKHANQMHLQVAIATFLQWASIYISHIGFRLAVKAQGIKPKTLPFLAPFAPYAQYFGLVVILFILGCEFYLAIFPFGAKGSAKSFFSIYLAAPLFIFDYFAYKVRGSLLSKKTLLITMLTGSKLYFKTKLVKPAEVDLSDALIFDEEDRVRAQAAAQDGEIKEKKAANVVQGVKNLIFG